MSSRCVYRDFECGDFECGSLSLGEFYIVQTVLRGRTWLRTALMNSFTTIEHLAAMLDALDDQTTG